MGVLLSGSSWGSGLVPMLLGRELQKLRPGPKLLLSRLLVSPTRRRLVFFFHLYMRVYIHTYIYIYIYIYARFGFQNTLNGPYSRLSGARNPMVHTEFFNKSPQEEQLPEPWENPKNGAHQFRSLMV